MVGNCVGESRRYSRSPPRRDQTEGVPRKKEGQFLAKFKIIPSTRAIARFTRVTRIFYDTFVDRKMEGEGEGMNRNKKIEAVSLELLSFFSFTLLFLFYFFFSARFRVS